jgi:hypothetical protein
VLTVTSIHRLSLRCSDSWQSMTTTNVREIDSPGRCGLPHRQGQRSVLRVQDLLCGSGIAFQRHPADQDLRSRSLEPDAITVRLRHPEAREFT